MEDFSFIQEQKSEELIVTPQAREFLRETARWAKFLAILGFVMMAFLVIAGIFMGAFMSTMYGSMGYPGFPSWFFSAIYLFMAAIYVAPLYFLYQFSSKANIALESNDNQLLTEALGFLKSHYKYIGILMIVIMAFYALVIVFAIIAGVAAGVSSF